MPNQEEQQGAQHEQHEQEEHEQLLRRVRKAALRRWRMSLRARRLPREGRDGDVMTEAALQRDE